MPESKECRICHRIGYRAFVPEGDYGWVCARDDLCRARAIMRMDAMGQHEYEPCGRGICAANAGHEGSCAAASGWADVSLSCDVGRHSECTWDYPIDCNCWHHNPAVQAFVNPAHHSSEREPLNG